MKYLLALILTIVFLWMFLLTLAGCTTAPDIYKHGKITYQNLEGGFWSIMPEAVVPRNLPEKFKKEGLRVRYIYKNMELQKIRSTIQWGKGIDLIIIEVEE